MKRKIDNADGDTLLTLQPSSSLSSALGPVIASFTSADPPSNTPFVCYHKSAASAAHKDDHDFADQDILVAGETNHVAFWTRLSLHDAPAGQARYIVGLRSKSRNTVTLRDTPVHMVTRDVKRLRLANSSSLASERMAQRASLARAFGTKKSLKAVRARERNQVNVDAMVGVLEVMKQSVEGRTDTLPTADLAAEISDNSRLIPPFNRDAESLQDVYPISSLAPESELSTIKTYGLESAAGDLARTRKILPFNRSKYINSHLQTLCSGKSLSAADRRSVQLLVYMSALLFLRVSQRSLDKAVLGEKLKSLPQATIDGLLARFTSTTRNSEKLQMTTDKETLLLSTILVCCLHLDDFIVDFNTVSQDLSLGTPRVQELFKSLGCKIEVPNAADCRRLGLSEGTFGGEKRAILRVPLTFPKPKTKKARR